MTIDNSSLIFSSKQLSLFDAAFDNRIRRELIDGEMRFSVLDVFKHYGKAKNPTTSWNTVLVRLTEQGFDPTREILVWQYNKSDGSPSTPTATFKTMLRIAQVTTFKEWEPLRQWMAEVANERIEEAKHIGLGTQRAKERDLVALKRMGFGDKDSVRQLEVRIDNMASFKSLMSSVSQVCDNPRYGDIVNAEYFSMFGEIASGLKILLNTKSVRDELPALQLSYLTTAELGLQSVVKQYDTMTMDQVLRTIDLIVQPLGDHLKMMCDVMGVHHVTGGKLLGRGE